MLLRSKFQVVFNSQIMFIPLYALALPFGAAYFKLLASVSVGCLAGIRLLPDDS